MKTPPCTDPSARCPACGERFDCGVASARCWCVDRPPLQQADLARDEVLATRRGCLCPRCLDAALARRGARLAPRR